jgi:sarcosine oxidase/L-pipecolate oxidase
MFSNQSLTSDKAWVFAHIQLTPQEAAEYKNVPVVYDGEYGFFFEPNE